MDTPAEAESVVRDLTQSCGCERSDIGLMARGPQSEATGATGATSADSSSGSAMASGALKGAGTGAAVGGVLGLVAGAAALTIPGLGPLIAAGPIAAALGGAGIGAAAGGLIGALSNLGVPEEEAHYYAEGVKRGGTLVTLHARSDDVADCAAEVMRRHGAVDIDQRAAEWKEQGWSGRWGEEPSARSATATQGEQVLPVANEELVVGKREVGKGGVRVYSRVTETPVEETVALREEHAQIERQAVDRPIGAGDSAFQEKSVEISETAEEPVVSKRARVTEEVRVGKQATERQQTVRDTVRKTDVEVENAGAATRPASRPYAGKERRRSTATSSYTGPERRAALFR
jgi:uncharacterized protein (TIGR02271 family)